MTAEIRVTFDAHDPRRLGLFWREVLDYAVDPPPGCEVGDPVETADAWLGFLTRAGLPESLHNSAFGIIDPSGKGPRIFFQQVPEDKVAKNRVHLDVRAAPGLAGDARMAAPEVECERVVALGAVRLKRFEPDGGMSAGFIVMSDPEGNEFCLD
ncbi:VOC family protein [Nocardioides sp. B-3]|uniref:VOC family protein n=1 Tax=Nocardioides sp. B-3 TaxID=2895565 RepID=UPI0021526D7E|nr:VOC family protein [Nocardioides sp. B-3]UUZ58374.1 VOC family protein [Nocardioides sp. B-3]